MIKLFLGIIIGILLALLGFGIRSYLRKNHLKLNVKYIIKNTIIILVIFYYFYSLIGIIVSPYYAKSNGNICKGFKYGLKVCSGDINAE